MRESFILRIDCDDPVRYIATANNRLIPSDDVEPDDDALYIGGGNLISIPDQQALLNNKDDRIDITLSGVTASAMALFLEEAPNVKGSTLHTGVASFDDYWQLVSVAWRREYVIDKLTPTWGQGKSGASRTIGLSMASDDAVRSNAPVAFWTAADQARMSPTDALLDHIAGINAGTSRRFGIKGS